MASQEYQIKQLFRSAYFNTSYVIFSSNNKNQALREFERLKTNLPDEYFELLMVEKNETLIDYTPIIKESWLAERIIKD
jgi:ribulose bisphosphate carboxylase small subunit